MKSGPLEYLRSPLEYLQHPAFSTLRTILQKFSMSEDESRKRVKKGHSDGAYKASKPHGLTNRFQPSWLKDPSHPLREHWLRDGGLDGNDEYVVECLFAKPPSRAGSRM